MRTNHQVLPKSELLATVTETLYGFPELSQDTEKFNAFFIRILFCLHDGIYSEYRLDLRLEKIVKDLRSGHLA
jgi:hypothetical protein